MRACSSILALPLRFLRAASESKNFCTPMSQSPGPLRRVHWQLVTVFILLLSLAYFCLYSVLMSAPDGCRQKYGSGYVISLLCRCVFSGAAAVGCGDEFTCVLTLESGVRCWGVNTSGRLGIGSNAIFADSPPSYDVINNVRKLLFYRVLS